MSITNGPNNNKTSTMYKSTVTEVWFSRTALNASRVRFLKIGSISAMCRVSAFTDYMQSTCPMGFTITVAILE